MAQPFTPITAPAARPGGAAGGPAPGAPAPAPRPAAAAPFTPLQLSVAPRGAEAGSACGQPRVSVDREGERITGIRVECPCGQVIDLECSY
jgi:hypothetical protein